jgi:excisionase family DNA binding protein
VVELAELLRVSEYTIRQWAARGLIPKVQPADRGKILFDVAAVREALRTSTAGRTAEYAGTPAGAGV